ncbi:uncharacterized protein LOC143211606 isoform X2 [Lasioglossum baleicum]|uniref:uncharacterized protein LOC143211606 isoform X2 n=1 Tax=Lasioglossum baleicum TaxID=434251 RepID=UPI003FCD2E23
MFVKDYTQLRILIYKVHVNSLPCNEEYYKYGLSTLHCWIRFMEYRPHVSYNLDFEKGSARTIEEKKLQAARKKKVQNSLKDLSITVDVVKQGAGTSNTGNVARTFFRKAESVVAVTGLNAAIITRLHNIHQHQFIRYCNMEVKYLLHLNCQLVCIQKSYKRQIIKSSGNHELKTPECVPAKRQI